MIGCLCPTGWATLLAIAALGLSTGFRLQGSLEPDNGFSLVSGPDDAWLNKMLPIGSGGVF